MAKTTDQAAAMKTKKKDPRITADGALAIVRKERNAREKACWGELETLLQKQRCRLMTKTEITPDGRIATSIGLEAH